MSRKWTRSELRSLLQGDRKTLEDWLSENADFLYTGMICRDRLAPARARHVTSNVFRFALDELDDFRAAQTSMYQWLRSLARREIDVQEPSPDEPEALPADWAAVSPETAEALVRMAEKPLPESIADDSPAAGLIRAAIADMDAGDREMLLARYHHFNSGPTLFSSLNLTAEEALGRLVRARHEFRLKLHEWIRRSVPSVPLPSPSVRTEVFDANLELLFQAVSPVIPLPEDTAARLFDSLSRQTAQINVSRHHAVMQRRVLVLAGASILIAVLLVIGIVIAPDRDVPLVAAPMASPSEPTVLLPDPGEAPAEMPAETPAARPDIPQPTDEALIQQTFADGTRQDIPALLEILHSGRYAPQIVAAHFLGRYGDASVINPLQEAAEQWYSEERGENPFLAAIEAIEERLRQPPPEPEPAEPVELPAEVDSSDPELPAGLPAGEDPNQPPALDAPADPNGLSATEPLTETPADPNNIQAPELLTETTDPNAVPAEWLEEYEEWTPETQSWQEEPIEPAIDEDPNQEYLLDSLRPVQADRTHYADPV